MVLSYPICFAYSVGHVLNDLCAAIWFSYTLLFFAFVLEFDNTLAGATIVIGQIADGISTPIVGLLSDKKFDSWLCKYGKRKTWHLIGTLCIVFSFPLIFSPYYAFQRLTQSQQLLYYSVLIVLFQFGWACTQVSHLSLATELTPHQDERTSLISLRYSFGVLSTIAVYIIFFAELHFNKGCNDNKLGPYDRSKFQLLAFIVVVLGAIFSAVFHILVKEKHESSDDAELLSESNSSHTSVFRNNQICNVACVYITSRLFANLSQVYIPYYLHTYLQLFSKNLAILPLVMFISSFITSTIIKQFNVEFGRRITYLFGALIGVLACIWIRIGIENDYYFKTYEIYGAVIAFGCANAIILVTSMGITADLIGKNTHNGAFVFGIMSLGDKVCNGVAVLVIEKLKIADYKPYYRDALTISCSVAIVIGLVAVCTIKPYQNASAVITAVNEENIGNDLEEKLAHVGTGDGCDL